VFHFTSGDFTHRLSGETTLLEDSLTSPLLAQWNGFRYWRAGIGARRTGILLPDIAEQCG
jgi:hypothetical protein